jgi:hypothetical protein
MKYSFYLLFFVFICLISCGLYASDGKTDPCRIKGQVVDAVTKRPVSGVLVSVSIPGDTESKDAITDEDGYYYFKQLPSNHVNLRFEKKGYQKYKYQDIIEVAETKTVKVNVQFLPDNCSELTPDDAEYPLLRILGMK